jgi:hypothetical protein
VREAAKDDVELLHVLKGHLQEGQFLTRFRKTFLKSEMSEDLVMVPAQVGGVADRSEHEEALRTVIFGGPRGFPGPGFPGPGFPGPGGLPRGLPELQVLPPGAPGVVPGGAPGAAPGGAPGVVPGRVRVLPVDR